MHEQCLFNFRPNCLVRMSKDDIIDQYDIFPIKIGEGNDAVVYKAKQKISNGLWRAVKKIHRRYVQKEEYLLTEIQVLKKLDHPGVLKIFEVFDDSQYVFIVTELCEGDSLLQQLRKRHYFSEPQAKRIFKKIIQIVAYCHQNKIIHRDLKLENLVYCSNLHTPQSLRLIDFGMAFQWHTNARSQIKNTFSSNKVVGTVYYMAPQIQYETYDHRVDIWSVGVILFFLLTGQLPFFQDDDEEILEAIQQRIVPYEKLKHRKCSREVIELLKKIFQPENKRITVEEILNHPWLQQSDQENHRSLEQKSHYFSHIPFHEFEILEGYYNFCRQKISQIALTDRSICIQSPHDDNLFKTLNWNNVYEFLKMDIIEKAIKVYLTYRMGHDHSHRYIKIFNYFKSNKRQQVHLQNLLTHLEQEYQSFMSRLGENLVSTQKNISEPRKIKRALSLEDQKAIYSVKKVYKELMTFLQTYRHNSIGFTMFVSWICDYSEFDKKQLEFLRNSLRAKGYEVSHRDPIEGQIVRIHKFVRHVIMEKKKTSKSEYNHSTSISPLGNLSENPPSKQRQLPKLTLKVEKDPNTNLLLKKTPKKSIKQNIFESISPTWIRKNPLINQLSQKKSAQTERPKGSRLLQHQQSKTQSGFMHEINKLISFW